MKTTKLLVFLIIALTATIAFLSTSAYLYKQNRCTVVYEYRIKRAYSVCYEDFQDFLAGRSTTKKMSMYLYHKLQEDSKTMK